MYVKPQRSIASEGEAASRLISDPIWARERMEHGRKLLAESMQKLHEAERTMDDY